MTRNDDQLQRALEGIRGDEAPPSVTEAAARRVFEELSHRREASSPAYRATATDRIEGCDDFQALVPAYLEGGLPASRRALLEDHVASCLPCRRALKRARGGEPLEAAPAPRTSPGVARLPLLRAAAMTGVAVALGAALVAYRALRSDPGGRSVEVVSVEGTLLAVTRGGEPVPLDPSTRIDGGTPIRTTKGSRAVVRLSDGSTVELRERSELSVSADRRGRTVELARGAVVIHAAKQGSGHLYLATRDCLVSVTGTIFSVDHGTKGSRVSVLEGEVHVDAGRGDTALRPGDQMTTDESIGRVPLEEEFSWSRDRDHYVALLDELVATGRELTAVASERPLGSASRLLDLAPTDTVVYAALPNISDSLATAHRILRDRIEANDALRGWWATHVGSRDADIGEAIGEIRAFGELVGEELVLCVGTNGGPLFLAETAREGELAERIRQRTAEMAASGLQELRVRLVEEPAAASSGATGGPELLLWVGEGILAAAWRDEPLAHVARVRRGEANPFVGSRFHGRLELAYQGQLDWLVAGDLHGIVAHTLQQGGNAELLRRAGALDADAVVIEQREVGSLGSGRSEARAMLTFDGPRRGVASWLAPPSPMGSLDFVSPQARLLFAMAVKEPAAMVDDLLHILEATGPDAARSLARLESEAHIRLRDDIAAPLGGEVAFAVDGAILPFPAWKLIVEVYDPAAFQATIEWAVQQLDVDLRQAGRPGVALEQVALGPYTMRTLRFQSMQVHYLLADGYAIFAATPAVLEQAMTNRAAGHTIARSARFQRLLPSDARTNFSALFYQDLGTVLSEVGGLVGGSPRLDAVAQRMRQMAGPSLAYAYAEEDRIVLASDTAAPLLPFALEGIAGSGAAAPTGAP